MKIANSTRRMSREGNRRYNKRGSSYKYGSYSPNFHSHQHGSESPNWREPQLPQSSASPTPSHKTVSSAHVTYAEFLTKGWDDFEKVKALPDSNVKVISERKVSDEPVFNIEQWLLNQDRTNS